MTTTGNKGTAHYKVVHTKAGRHIVIVGGNSETVAHGEPLSSVQNACKAIKAIARMHAYYGEEVAMTPDLNAVNLGVGARSRSVPVVWVDERKPSLPARALSKLVGTPKGVQARAEAAAPIRNGDSHDA